MRGTVAKKIRKATLEMINEKAPERAKFFKFYYRKAKKLYIAGQWRP